MFTLHVTDEVLDPVESGGVARHSDAGASPLIVRGAVEVLHLVRAALLHMLQLLL